eukprot:3319877-Amphidinium_carterae.2
MTLAGLQSWAMLNPGRSSFTCSVPGENPTRESGTGQGVRARVCPGVRCCAFVLWVSLAVLQFRTFLSPGRQSVVSNCPGRDATQETGTVQGTLA